MALATAKLALVQEDEGRLTEAEASLKESLAMRQRLLGPNSPDVARNLLLLAAVERKQRRYPESAIDIARAADIDRQVGATAPLWADLHFQQGLLLDAEGKFDCAESLLRECLADRRARLGEHDLHLAETQMALAQVLSKEHQASEAKQLAQSVLPMLSGTLPAAQAVRREANALLSQPAAPY